MDRRQKIILIDFIIVIVITAAAVVAMVNFKDWVNHSEAMRAMKQFGQIVLQYRKDHGSVPPESYVNRIKENLQGYVRLGDLQYRAQWLDFDSSPDEILAYTEKKYPSSLLDDGFVVLRLDGHVEWMGAQQFKDLLAQQQGPMEKRMLEK